MEKLYILDVRKITKEEFASSLYSLPVIEKDKIMSYSQEKDRFLSLGARLVIKKFIKEYIGYNKYGKPVTEFTHFNISHCYPYVILYMNNKSEVGADIEFDRPLDEKMVENCFSQRELINKKPTELWTIKEAYLKYLGLGISVKMNKINLDIKGKYFTESEKNVFYKTFKYDGFFITLISEKKIKVRKPKILNIKKVL